MSFLVISSGYVFSFIASSWILKYGSETYYNWIRPKFSGMWQAIERDILIKKIKTVYFYEILFHRQLVTI